MLRNYKTVCCVYCVCWSVLMQLSVFNSLSWYSSTTSMAGFNLVSDELQEGKGYCWVWIVVVVWVTFNLCVIISQLSRPFALEKKKKTNSNCLDAT